MSFKEQEKNLQRLREAGKELVGSELPKTYTVTKDKTTVTKEFQIETRNRKRLNYNKRVKHGHL